MTPAAPFPAHGPVRVGSNGPALGLGRPGRVLAAVGTGCVVLGGLVAAATGPLRLAEESWLAAYLVLVGGVSQYAIGRVPTLVAAAPTPGRWGWAQIVCWNLGNVAVVTGTLIATPALVDVGAAFLAAGLVIAWLVVRRIDVTKARSRAVRVGCRAYRGLLLLLLASLPIGVLLAHLRHA